MKANYQSSHIQSKISALMISLMIVVVSISVAIYVKQSQKQVLHQILSGHGDRIKVTLVNSITDLTAEMKAMKNRWLNHLDTPEERWRADSIDFIQRTKGVNSIWLINQDLNCVWLAPESVELRSRCESFIAEPDHLTRLSKPKKDQVIEFSEVRVVDNENTIYLFQPLGFGDNFDGYVAVELKVQSFIDYALGNPVNSGYYTKSFDNKKQVYNNGPEQAQSLYVHSFDLNMDDDKDSWVFEVTPTEVILNLIITPLPIFIAITGTTMALLFMLALLSKQKAKNESLKLATEISKKEKVQFELEYLANHDSLTHLPNRHYITKFIQNKVNQAKINGSQFTILFIDLDHFKDINDSLGHAVGDEMLKSLPVIFNQVFRHDDIIARMGGDEFVVYLPGQLGEESVTALINRFLKHLERPVKIQEHAIRLTGSVGVAFYPEHGKDVTELLSHADAALYRAKDKGRNTFAIYDSQIEQSIKDRIEMISNLHKAYENDEFEMYFQPRVNLATDEVNGAEALIRWNHIEQGVVTPSGFLNLLEDTALIVPITYKMLTKSCIQFIKIHEINADLFMSFNISARLLEEPDFLIQLKTILVKTHFPPEKLELELTEQVLIQNIENSQYILNEVKRLGVSIAIDDFGTGYSSLSYLKNFPVDVLKIDKSFILDIQSDSGDLELVKTILNMGKNLNIITVAEGVETQAQLHILRAEKCDQVQGYLFSKPMRFDDLSQFLLNS